MPNEFEKWGEISSAAAFLDKCSRRCNKVDMSHDFERRRSLQKPEDTRTGELCVNVTTGMTSNLEITKTIGFVITSKSIIKTVHMLKLQ